MTLKIDLKQTAIKLNGAYLEESIMVKLLDIEVDTSLYVPSMFALRFYDEDLSLTDSAQFDISSTIQIQLPNADSDQLTSVVSGEITSIEPDFGESFIATLTIRGYDKGHRLNRGTHTRVFQNATDTDIATKIAQQAKLKIVADATTTVHEHVFQHNQTDYAFLRERARLNNFELVVIDDTLYFRKSGVGDQISLEWGNTLRSFHPRLALAEQVTQVQVKGWDILSKRELIATKSSSDMSPEVGVQSPEAMAAKFSSDTEFVELHQPVTTQAEAEKLAQSLIAEIDAGFIEAEGTAFGVAALTAGKKVKLSKLGQRFSGTYFVTSATHLYSPKTGYDTHFVIEGVRRRLVSDLVSTESSPSQSFSGVYPALVTNIKDPKNMGRVKLKFPWLDSNSESGWARISTVGGGNTRGVFWMPEVNDEVLVAFEHGNFDQPYVLGGLYNGVDAPPATASAVVPTSAVEKRIIQTKRHIITFSESASEEQIEIKDLSDKAVLRLTSKPQGKIEILCKQGDVSIEATNITAKATGQVNITGATVKAEAQGQLDLKGAIVNVESSGPLKIKGAIVNIN